MEPRDFFYEPHDTTVERREVESYVYEDEDCEPLYLVVRFEPKGFAQCRPNGSWGIGDVRRVLYRLPEVIAAVEAGHTVYVCEGEKDVEALRRVNCVATCNPGGAGQWKSEYAGVLAGADVVVVADRDPAGRQHARDVAESLMDHANSVRIVEAASGKDASDHLAAGRTIEQFVPTAENDERLPPAHLPVIRWSDIQKPTTFHYLIKGLIPKGGLGMVFGAWGSSKSFAMLDAAAHVAAGESWMGLRVQQAPVVYVCAEGAGGFVNRAAALKMEKFFDIPLLVVPVAVNLLDAAAVDRLADAIHEHEPATGLMVFDTWAQSIAGANEEKQSEIQPALAACARLRQEFGGLTTLVVHHPGRNQQERSRGAYGLEAACDFIARVTKGGDICKIEVTKAKDGPLLAPLSYRLRVVELGHDQDGDPITTCVIDPCEDPNRPSSRVAKVTRSEHGRLLVGVMEEQIPRIGTLAPPELREALAAQGLAEPEPGKLVVRADTLADSYADRAGQMLDTKPDSVARGFRRAIKALHRAGIVDVFREWVWFK